MKCRLDMSFVRLDARASETRSVRERNRFRVADDRGLRISTVDRERENVQILLLVVRSPSGLTDERVSAGWGTVGVMGTDE